MSSSRHFDIACNAYGKEFDKLDTDEVALHLLFEMEMLLRAHLGTLRMVPLELR